MSGDVNAVASRKMVAILAGTVAILFVLFLISYVL